MRGAGLSAARRGATSCGDWPAHETNPAEPAGATMTLLTRAAAGDSHFQAHLVPVLNSRRGERDKPTYRSVVFAPVS